MTSLEQTIEKFILSNFFEISKSDIMELFRAVDSLALRGDEDKFNEFRPVTTGYDMAYRSLLSSIGIEITEELIPPLMTYLNDIYEEYHEERLSEEEAWEVIRRLMTEES